MREKQNNSYTGIKRAVQGFTIAAITMGIYGLWKSTMKHVKINHLSIEIGKLPPAFSGLQILHISDLHATRENQSIWKDILEIEADIAVFTGDFTTNDPEKLITHLPFCQELSDKMPVYYVYGNHETYHQDSISAMLDSVNWINLTMDEAFIERNGEKLPILGISDWYQLKGNNFADLDIYQNKRMDEFFILLSHQPQIIEFFKEKHTIIFAGHTHGGQIKIPGLPVLYAPGQGLLPMYGEGLYKRNNALLYVSTGIGTTRFPFRFFNPPEINVLTLLTPET